MKSSIPRFIAVEQNKSRKMAIRKDLVQAFRAGAGLTLRESALCVDALVEWMNETLARGEGIELRGLGTFSLKLTAEKKAVLNDSPLIVPSHGKVIFRPCKKLKAAIWKQKR